MANRLRNRRR